MSWIALVIAGCSEVFGVIGMKGVSVGKGWKAFMLMVVSFVISFSLLNYAMKSLPMGTSYAVWTGIGTVGSTITGMFLYGEQKSVLRVLFIAMILAAALGLKLIS